MYENRSLTPVQLKALALIAAGATARAAAAAAGVHRHTIANWLRLSEFQEALAVGQYEYALALRDQTAALAAGAIATIREILIDPMASAGARLKAALAVLDRVAAPLPRAPVISEAVSEIMSKNVQAPVEVQPEIQEIPQPAAGSQPKIGRNEPCPCGSNLKFKRCCLGKIGNRAALLPPRANYVQPAA